jgi:hypothetical protein
MNAKEARTTADKVKQISRAAQVERQKIQLINSIKFEAKEGNYSLVTNANLYAENLKWLTENKYHYCVNRGVFGEVKSYEVSWKKIKSTLNR